MSSASETQPSNNAEGKPRQLRLSMILASLAAAGHETVPAATSSNPTQSDTDFPQSLTKREKRRKRSDLSIGEIVDRARGAGFGFMIGFLGLASLPFVGLSTPFGLAIALVALQMVFGFQRPWLPQRIRRHLVSIATLEWLSHRLARWTGGLEKLVRPRFEVLSRGPFWSLCGVCIIILGAGLALPIPIPGSNAIFVIPIILYAIGLLEADGLLIMFCHTIVVVQLCVAVAFSGVVYKAIISAFNWFIGGL